MSLDLYTDISSGGDPAARLYHDPKCIMDSHRAISCTVTGSAMRCLTCSIYFYLLQNLTCMRALGRAHMDSNGHHLPSPRRAQWAGLGYITPGPQ